MFWHARHNPGGFFDLRIMRDVAVMTGAAVGGGSIVYANVQLRAPDDVFDDPAWPAAIDAAGLRPYYDRTEQALQPRETPAEPALPKIRAFDAMAASAGLQAERLPIAVHFGEARRHPFSGVHQEGCQNLGRCDIGCPRQRAQHRRHHLRRARREPRRGGLPAARGLAHPAAGTRRRRLDGRLPRPAVPHRRRGQRAGRRARRRHARLVAAAAEEPRPAAAPVARARHALLGQRRRARARDRPQGARASSTRAPSTGRR